MKKPDDCSLTPQQLKMVRRHAELLLKEAGAEGIFPTPVSAIISAAKLTVEGDVSLDTSFLTRIYHKVTGRIKRAMDKIRGLFDANDRTIYLDLTVHKSKRTFLALHETGHGFMPHQKELFAFIEESDASLDPEVRDVFDREANVFASEVLFQLDRFTTEAADRSFCLETPVNLARHFGASCYAAIRRYVTTHREACAVLVLEKPEYIVGRGWSTSLRRCFQSDRFSREFGNPKWPLEFSPGDPLTAGMATTQGFAVPTIIQLRNLDGDSMRCVAESFNSSYQVFVLIRPERSLTRKAVHVAV